MIWVFFFSDDPDDARGYGDTVLECSIVLNNPYVVKKLIGSIEPVGETNTDEERFENLKQMAELTEQLLAEIQSVVSNIHSYEYSVKRAGEFAKKFLDDVRNQ